MNLTDLIRIDSHFQPWGPTQPNLTQILDHQRSTQRVHLGLQTTVHGWTRIWILSEVNQTQSNLFFDSEAPTRPSRINPKIRLDLVALELVCCKKQQKSSWSVTGLWNRGPLRVLNDSKLVLKVSPGDFPWHLGLIWNLQRFVIHQTINWKKRFWKHCILKWL